MILLRCPVTPILIGGDGASNPCHVFFPPAQCSQEDRQIMIAIDAMEALLHRQHGIRRPALRHVALRPPASHPPGIGPKVADRIIDGIGAQQADL